MPSQVGRPSLGHKSPVQPFRDNRRFSGGVSIQVPSPPTINFKPEDFGPPLGPHEPGDRFPSPSSPVYSSYSVENAPPGPIQLPFIICHFRAIDPAVSQKNPVSLIPAQGRASGRVYWCPRGDIRGVCLSWLRSTLGIRDTDVKTGKAKWPAKLVTIRSRCEDTARLWIR